MGSNRMSRPTLELLEQWLQPGKRYLLGTRAWEIVEFKQGIVTGKQLGGKFAGVERVIPPCYLMQEPEEIE